VLGVLLVAAFISVGTVPIGDTDDKKATTAKPGDSVSS
jgi:hypothetical protein